MAGRGRTGGSGYLRFAAASMIHGACSGAKCIPRYGDHIDRLDRRLHELKLSGEYGPGPWPSLDYCLLVSIMENPADDECGSS